MVSLGSTTRRLAAGLWVVATTILGLPIVVAPSQASAAALFTDVPPTHPFVVPITWIANGGISTGYPDGSFRPAELISRQAFASFLWKYSDMATAGFGAPSDFLDVPDAHPFAGAIDWLSAAGIAQGYEDLSFHPEGSITRQSVAAFLWRYAGEPTPPASAPTFSDVPIESPFREAIAWLASTGITTGYASGKFGPSLPITRQAMAAFLWRFDAAGSTIRTSVSNVGLGGSTDAWSGPLSGDGRFASFHSDGTGYTAGDTGIDFDVFLRDQINDLTTRESVTDGEGQASGDDADVSEDGRFVAFASGATDLVPNDTNGFTDVFVRDRVAESTTRVSVATGGGQAVGSGSYAPSISDDGRFVAFESFATNLVADDTSARDVFLHDRITGITTRASVSSEGVGGSDCVAGSPSLSGDGAFVAFEASCDSFVAGDANQATDIFVRDVGGGTTTRASIADDESESDHLSLFPSISDDGRFVAFQSRATNLVAGDTNGIRDIFVRDLTAGITVRVNVSTAGVQTPPTDDYSKRPVISGNGRFVAFYSSSDDLVDGDLNYVYDVYLRDLRTGITSRVSITNAGSEASASSLEPDLSDDGSVVSFTSYASNLVPNDTNGRPDAYIRLRFAPASS